MTVEIDELERDARRYRALREYLSVERPHPTSFTCWLELAEIPLRALSTTTIDELVDRIAGFQR